MPKNYLKYRESLEKVQKIKFLDESTKSLISIKTKEDYRKFYNSKLEKNKNLRVGLPRHPEQYYKIKENIDFKWFVWLGRALDNYYHFKGKYRKKNLDIKIHINFKSSKKILIDYQKLYEDIRDKLFYANRIDSKRNWIAFYKSYCKKEGFTGSLLSLDNFFKKNDKRGLIWSSWSELTTVDLVGGYSQRRKKYYLSWEDFVKQVRGSLIFLKQHQKEFNIKKNDLDLKSIKDWKFYFQKFKTVIYYYDKVDLNSLKNIRDVRFQTNQIPYYPHIHYKENFLSYAHLSQQSFYHENSHIVSIFTRFNFSEVFLKHLEKNNDDENFLSFKKNILIKKSSNAFQKYFNFEEWKMMESILNLGIVKAKESYTQLISNTSNSLKNFIWKCPNCSQDFEASFKRMADNKISLNEKHHTCTHPNRFDKSKKYLEIKSIEKIEICEVCNGLKKIIDEDNIEVDCPTCV